MAMDDSTFKKLAVGSAVGGGSLLSIILGMVLTTLTTLTDNVNDLTIRINTVITEQNFIKGRLDRIDTTIEKLKVEQQRNMREYLDLRMATVLLRLDSLESEKKYAHNARTP